LRFLFAAKQLLNARFVGSGEGLPKERAITVWRAVPTESDWWAERADRFKNQLQASLVRHSAAALPTPQPALAALWLCLCAAFVGTPRVEELGLRHYPQAMMIMPMMVAVKRSGWIKWD